MAAGSATSVSIRRGIDLSRPKGVSVPMNRVSQ